MDGENRIWLYWEDRPGSRMPAYIDLSMQTIKAHAGAYEVVLLNEKTVGDYVQLPARFHRIKQLAHKADYVRAQLLYHYGGVWLDSDIILLRDIESAVSPYIQDYDFVGYGREYGKPSIGFMACRRHCRLIELWVEHLERVLNKRGPLGFRRNSFEWTELGHNILWPLAGQYSYYHYERKMFAPVFFTDWQVFASEVTEPEYITGHNPFSVMLYNKFMFSVYEKVSAADILWGRSLLSKLFRVALHL